MNAAIGQVFLSVYRERSNIGAIWFSWLILALAVALAVFLPVPAKAVDPWGFKCIILGAAGSLFMIMWWLMLVQNAQRQCTPQNAHLAPRLRNTVTAAVALAWLTGSLCLAAILSLGLGHLIPVWIGIGLVMLGFAGITSGNMFVAVPYIALFFIGENFRKFIIESGILEGEPMATGIAIALLLLLLAATLTGLFGLRGERAIRAQAKLCAQQEKMKGRIVNNRKSGWQRAFSLNLPYDFALKHALIRRSKAVKMEGMSSATLLRYGFGPAFHWAVPMYMGLFILVAYGCIFAANLVLSDSGIAGVIKNALAGSSFVVRVSGAYILLTTLIWMLAALYQTRREQALLLLLPGMPQGGALNRMVAGMALSQVVFALASGVAVSAATAFNTPWNPFPPDLAWGSMLAVVPISAFALRNYAAMRDTRHFMLVIPPFVIGGIIGGMHSFEFPWQVICAIVLTVSAGLFALQWRRAVYAPFALPVGRLAAAKVALHNL